MSNPNTHAGQAIYSDSVLAKYDRIVLGFSNRWLWRCRTDHLLSQFNDGLSPQHLDVGVGSGWYPDRCTPPEGWHLTLGDLNPTALAYAANRAARHEPQTVQWDVFEPFPDADRRFDSITAFYLLHCLPGDMTAKNTVLQNLHDALAPGGVLTGATIVADRIGWNPLARIAMWLYNRKGIFGNRHDTVDDLRTALASVFDESSIETVGAVAIFRAAKAGR